VKVWESLPICLVSPRSSALQLDVAIGRDGLVRHGCRESADRLANKKREAKQKMVEEAARMAQEAAMLTKMAETKYS